MMVYEGKSLPPKQLAEWLQAWTEWYKDRALDADATPQQALRYCAIGSALKEMHEMVTEGRVWPGQEVSCAK